jgi:hypothetical protein
VRWIRGNGERELAEAVATAPPADETVDRTAWIRAAEIGDERALALGALPLTIELDGVLSCHASPRHDDEMLTRLSVAERYADALAGVTAPLVVAGHTHQQDDRMVGDVRFVNAGSGGLARRAIVRRGADRPVRGDRHHAALRGSRDLIRRAWPRARAAAGPSVPREPGDLLLLGRVRGTRARRIAASMSCAVWGSP